ncbi:innexin unc-9-like [Lingula anatina]|uniref:Innexin n=1 Tax=Lingula anatina TaxID=7574 RepID=A0A1S3HA78_LINAN|nr:innexin unc-9-like [Lingula anatina]|eukprot:XP_013382927.1 innexin unc-9-like [Lingula anatina]
MEASTAGARMSYFLEVLGKTVKGFRNDDDFFDRLSHRYTSIFLIIFALVVSTKQYVGDPISCWTPSHFSKTQDDYTNSYCWIKNTYHKPMDERVPEKWEGRSYIGYYQWVPIVLFIQALMFYLPCLVWRILNSRVGIDVDAIVRCVSVAENVNPDARRVTIRYVTRHMDRYLWYHKHDVKGCASLWRRCCTCFLCGKRHGNYLTIAYLVTKCLYLANSIGQLFLLNSFLGTSYYLYGINVLSDMIQGRDWSPSSNFPRVTLCDFEIRFLGGVSNIHRHTVQCVLPINLFNEKIYIFIWFWLAFVTLATVFGIVTWVRLLFPADRRKYIKKYLKLTGQIHSNTDSGLVKVFVYQYLRQDGVFILKLLARNTNYLIVAEIVEELWETHSEKQRTQLSARSIEGNV